MDGVGEWKVQWCRSDDDTTVLNSTGRILLSTHKDHMDPNTGTRITLG